MIRLGDALRAQRERMGLTLPQAAEDTRIREKFLRALESGDYQTLPGAVYTTGFLRNYADYLGLDPDEQIARFRAERVTPDAPRSFEPMRPIMRRNVILTPAVLVPLSVLAAVVLFIGYLSYQLTTFAVPPRIEIGEPAGDALVQSAEYTLRGRTSADARITVRVFPGPETIANVRAAADGSFEARIPLRPGTNHVEVQVLDATGKVAQASRTIRYEVATSAESPGPPQLVIEQPANGATYTNSAVTVSGRVDRAVTGLLVNGTPVTPQPDGRFSLTVTFTAGPQAVRVVGRTVAGAEVQETRNVVVSYTSVVVSVRIVSGEAWLLALVDGAQAANTNRVFTSGQTVTFSGRQVILRTGNAAATFVTVNGEELGALGGAGQVVERTFSQ